LRRVAVGDVRTGLVGAAGLAAAFGAAGWGRAAGLWHDLGKYSESFQQYLKESHSASEDENVCLPRVDHSTFGAQHAIDRAPLGGLLAYIIAGHHGGLPDYLDLERRLKKDVAAPFAPPALLQQGLPGPPSLRPADTKRVRAFQSAFWTRMVFSCLVDADFLATESFMAADRRLERLADQPPDLASMKVSLDHCLTQLCNRAGMGVVNRERARVLRACRARATDPPGFFSLTVPTGGGKTLSSLAFSVDHALVHGLRRVIYAVPFTSTIEQNAAVFRRALAGAGRFTVLEHHWNAEPSDEEGRWSRFATENWEAPLVVTTNVQFFESLFHNKPSRCRKLHSIVRSVIVLDEAQAIPVGLLEPTLAALSELVRNYSCTVVLCTATQPALTRRDGFEIGLPPPREIVPDVPALFQTLRRVEIEPPRSLDNDSLASELAAQRQALCIVHTKSQAREVFELLRDHIGEPADSALARLSCLHLTTDMCAAHRLLVIRLVRRRLRLGLPCRVVSTSLIEAGVDVDFPVVYRAMAGLDSIAQAAGRCNREGRLARHGRVVLFTPTVPLPAYAREPARDAEHVIGQFQDLLAPDAIEAYFREHFWQKRGRWDSGALDSSGARGPVMECFRSQMSREPPHFMYDFRTAAERYCIITEDSTPVIVPWGRQGEDLIHRLRDLRRPPGRALRQRCQRYAVGVRQPVLAAMASEASVSPASTFAPGLFCLDRAECYHHALGLSPGSIEPERLIVGGDL